MNESTPVLVTVKAGTEAKYSETLELCSELKANIDKLKVLLKGTVNQGLSIPFEEKTKDLVNWIEEIKFNLTLTEFN